MEKAKDINNSPLRFASINIQDQHPYKSVIQTLSNLKNLITEIHQNYLITCDYVLSTINATNENIWINKLQNIIKSKINHPILKRKK